MKAILTYHSIDETDSPISVTAEQFENHRRWFVSRRVKALTLDQLVQHPGDGEDAVAITFDDGFLNIRAAVESLVQDDIPVTVFAVSGHAGATNAWGGQDQAGIPTLPLLSWSDLDHLKARGASIEAHTKTHPRLTALSSDAVDDELGGCRAELSSRLGVPCNHVAYPYGDVDERVAERARQFFAFGYTTEFSVVAARNDPLSLPRLDMFYFRTPGVLEQWGSPAFRRHVAWCRARRTVRSLVLLKGFRA